MLVSIGCWRGAGDTGMRGRRFFRSRYANCFSVFEAGRDCSLVPLPDRLWRQSSLFVFEPGFLVQEARNLSALIFCQSSKQAMAYQIEWSKKCVKVSYSGDCSAVDVLNAVIEIQSDYRFDSTYQALHDFTECQSLASVPEVLEQIAVQNIGAAVSNPNLRIAVIADHPDVLSMLDCFASLALSPYPLCVFQAIESALAWLEGASIGDLQAANAWA